MARQAFPLFAAFLLLFGVADDWLAGRTPDPVDDLLAAADNTYLAPAAGAAAGDRVVASPAPVPPALPPSATLPPAAAQPSGHAAGRTSPPSPRAGLVYLLMALRR